jgi:hypothetical protein
MNKDLDGHSGCQTRKFTEELLDSPEENSAHLWDSYGVDSDIHVGLSFPYLVLTTC